ncbi:MAG: hypothetical protein JJU34_13875 [Lunatimonas sp.]|uniref:hypothetical protein n=1 Tax=Lunatimonas sp. TaxID=2060141 RepID=UPI00263A4B60|nr:hypothetical protein [Lunatimonas sp.]MCC5938362.1 hypothetical protein [Lunatimonas sp.]
MRKKLQYLGLFIGMALLNLSCFVDRDRVTQDLFVGESAARAGVGQLANQLLSADRFTRLEIEMVYMSGFRPTNQMVGEMVAFLEEHTNKPDGIIFREREIPAGGQQSYTVQELRDLEKEQRQRYNERNILTVFLLVVDGYFSQDDEESFALGAAYQSTSMVLFGRRIAENSGILRRPGRAMLETTVVLHEIGHLMGLVNNGTDMVEDHEDEENESHCDNASCLMYWAVETNRVFGMMETSIPQLDQKCRDDIRANGGR